MTITSKELRTVVEQYHRSPSAAKSELDRHHDLHSRVLTPVERESYCLAFRHLGKTNFWVVIDISFLFCGDFDFDCLGLLAKRSTCLYATKDRLKFALKGVQKVLFSKERQVLIL